MLNIDQEFEYDSINIFKLLLCLEKNVEMNLKSFLAKECIESKETTDSGGVGQSTEGKMISMLFVGACLEMTA